MAQIVVEGRGEFVAFYNLREDLGFDLSGYNMASKKGQEELYEALKERIDSNEIESLSAIMQLRLLYADSIKISIENESFTLDEFKLKNRELGELSELLNSIEEGDLFYLLRRVGDGEFTFETNSDNVVQDGIELGYIECTEALDNIITDDIIESFCDTIDIDSMDIKDSFLEESSAYFDANVIIDALYSARFDKESESYILTRLEVGGERIIGTDCYIDDFEKN